MTPEQERRAKSRQDAWDRLVEQEQNVAVQSLTFVEIVSDRTVPKVLEAIARIYARLRRWGCPIYRLHGDKSQGISCPPNPQMGHGSWHSCHPYNG